MLIDLLTRARAAQTLYSDYPQWRVDLIFSAVATAASAAAIPLAQMAVEETGRGVMEDKVIKNRFAAENVHNAYRDTLTCGVISEDSRAGTLQIADPVGVIAALTPVTNPSSTIIYKVLLAIKTRNAIIIAPHPGTKNTALYLTQVLAEAAKEFGAPDNLISCVPEPSVQATSWLMHCADMVLATGGPAMVEAAYSSGTPAIGVGPGNTPAIIDETADLDRAVHSIITSKCFDNGMVCASEQTVIMCTPPVLARTLARFTTAGAYAVHDPAALEALMFPDGHLNPDVVGKSARWIAERTGYCVPETTKLLMVDARTPASPFCREKLSPVLAMLPADNFQHALVLAKHLLLDGGAGHTAVLHTAQDGSEERIRAFGVAIPAARLLVNQPATHGAIGDLYNFGMAPALTLGCGSWGGNSVAGQIGVQHLLNIKTVTIREENALWNKLPSALFFGRNCLEEALKDLPHVERAVLVTDGYLHYNGVCDPVIAALKSRGIQVTVFDEVTPDPTTELVERGAEVLRAVAPGLIVAVGGGSPMDAAKLMQVRYSFPELPFEHLALRFADIRKRIHSIPRQRALLVAIPTTSGTGSEVTPFAVITDSATGQKYPLADYRMTPHMAIVDSSLVETLPPSLVAAGGLDAIVHALEAYVSVFATEFTDGQALTALKLLHDHLPTSYATGHRIAREAVHRAATLAGMAFANAFLGVCHAMAHKLGARFNIPHGIANALLIETVIRYNAYAGPQRMTAFSQYPSPQSNARYTVIASRLGLRPPGASNGADALIDWLRDLKARMSVPASIQDWGVDEREFLASVGQLAIDAFDDQCVGANPRAPLVSDLRAMLLDSYYGTTTTEQLPE